MPVPSIKGPDGCSAFRVGTNENLLVDPGIPAVVRLGDGERHVLVRSAGHRESNAAYAVAFDPLPTGTYYMKETAVPEGYLDNGDIYEVHIEKTGSVIYLYENGAITGQALENIVNRRKTRLLWIMKLADDTGEAAMLRRQYDAGLIDAKTFLGAVARKVRMAGMEGG